LTKYILPFLCQLCQKADLFAIDKKNCKKSENSLYPNTFHIVAKKYFFTKMPQSVAFGQKTYHNLLVFIGISLSKLYYPLNSAH